MSAVLHTAVQQTGITASTNKCKVTTYKISAYCLVTCIMHMHQMEDDLPELYQGVAQRSCSTDSQPSPEPHLSSVPAMHSGTARPTQPSHHSPHASVH